MPFTFVMRPLLAGLALALSSTAALAVPVEGVWAGTYVCAQGPTPAQLYIRRAPTGRLDARFHFGDGSPMRPEGCFAMIGDPNPYALTLQATHWFLRPFAYVSVDLTGAVSGPVYEGSVIGPGCTAFQFTWHPMAPLPAACG